MKFNVSQVQNRVLVELVNDEGATVGSVELDYRAACRLIDDLDAAAFAARQIERATR